MKWTAYILLVIIAFIAGCFFRTCSPKEVTIETIKSDTVIVRDTVYPPVPEPKIITFVRRDTVKIEVFADVEDTVPRMVNDSVIIPITRNTYTTEDYEAVVEGYRPRLVSIELYPKTITITNTRNITKVSNPKWALTVGAGVAYIPGKGIEPVIGITAGYVFWSK